MSDIDTSNPLDMDLSSLDTSFPLAKSGQLADFKIVNATLMTNEAKTLKLELESLAELEGQESGVTLKAGTKLFDNVNTEPTGKSTWDIIKKGVASFLQGTSTPNISIRSLRDNPAQVLGQVVRIRIGIQPAGTGRDGVVRKARNEVAEYVKKTSTTN